MAVECDKLLLELLTLYSLAISVTDGQTESSHSAIVSLTDCVDL